MLGVLHSSRQRYDFVDKQEHNQELRAERGMHESKQECRTTHQTRLKSEFRWEDVGSIALVEAEI